MVTNKQPTDLSIVAHRYNIALMTIPVIKLALVFWARFILFIYYTNLYVSPTHTGWLWAAYNIKNLQCKTPASLLSNV